MKKICVMHNASIGDTLLATPVYRALKQSYPQAKIIAVVSYAGEEILQGNPYIDELIPYQKGDSIFHIIKAIWRSDVALILDYHYRHALYAFLALIPKRVGRGEDFINIKVKDKSNKEYEPLKYLRIAKYIGADSKNTKLTKIEVNDLDKRNVKKLLTKYGLMEKRFIVIVPFSLSTIKDWESSKYREIIKKIQDDGYKVVMLGGKNERQRIENEFPNVINFAGVTSLRESAAIIEKAKAQLCGCTAMLHVCATTQTPSIAIYGPTAPEQWAPRDNCEVISHKFSCSPCYHLSRKCTENRCIMEISVEEVYLKLRELLSR